MYKIKLVNRGINSRRLRKFNSATDLVGEQVVVSDGSDATKADVEAVKVNQDDSVDIDLSNGDQVNLEPEEAEELVSTGEVSQDDAEIQIEDPAPAVASRKGNGMERRLRRNKCNDDPVASEVETVVEEPKEFSVSRDVVDEDGNVDAVVTTKVDASDVDDAVNKVKMIDSRRGRNCRHYRINNSTPRRSYNGKKFYEMMNSPEVIEALQELMPEDEVSGEMFDYSNKVAGAKSAAEMLKVLKSEYPKLVKGYGFTPIDISKVNSLSELIDTIVKYGATDYDKKYLLSYEFLYDLLHDDHFLKLASEESRKSNSRRWMNSKGDPTAEDLARKEEIEAKPKSEWTEEEKKYMSETWGINCDMQEFKIQRNCGNGKRKVASVTAPSLEEAMEAVKAKDAKDGIQADGYAELTEEIAKVDPKINSDVEVEEEQDPKSEDEERKENSFKGVSDYVKRAYGINL